MDFIYTKSFRKALARLSPRQVDDVETAMSRFTVDRADPALRDHGLKGRMNGLRAFSAAHDLRVIYREEGGFITIVLLDAGTHNQVY